MGLETRLSLKQSQRLVMTPMLQQAIKLLPLQRLELISLIRNELTENPCVEEDLNVEQEDKEKKPIESSDLSDENSTGNSAASEEIDWETYFQNTVYQGLPADYVEKASLDTYVKKEVSLSEHLVWQLNISAENDKQKYIGTILIGNINDDGYLDVELDDICKVTLSSYDEVEDVLELIQTFDPVGVGARDIPECLSIQARSLDKRNPLVIDIVENFIELIEENNVVKLARSLKVSVKDIEKALVIIKDMNPNPGNCFKAGDIQYITPDVYIVKIDDDYHIVTNEEGIPKLKLNSQYQDALKKNNCTDGPTKTYIEDKYKSAQWLMKSIEQRRQTLVKVSASILKFQKDFFEHGLGFLKPLVLRDVASDIEMHESTVSRVTTNKYVHTPKGTFELKFFFHKGVDSIFGEESLSTVRVRQMLKEIVENEDHEHPHLDSQLAALLQVKNVKIARRTVTKYRKELNIPAASKRKVTAV